MINVGHSKNEKIQFSNSMNIELYMKREDELHPFVSGNKFRKLKYNLIEAKTLGFKTLLTFGGAFSNHIAAVSAAGVLEGFKTIGVIRGEELQSKIHENETLSFAKKNGMQLHFMSRENYRNKESKTTITELQKLFGEFYILPEGGTNTLAIKGCEEILSPDDNVFDFICCPVGTGGTVSGLINSATMNQKVLGFSALKGDFLKNNISKFVTQKNWELITEFHFGGYAKINEELIRFLNTFNSDFNILLDPVYTGKMMFGVFKMIKNGDFPKGAKILAIHTGGLQGIPGMNSKLKQKKLPLIKLK